ncbi:MAG: bacterial ammonia monooxygenase, subunit AmoB [Alicyclobacillaceae bacterium]|nr:bacterial ammonia monooxygenase, subunit AmoB [Alicyclobacillaceae bacterium]
MSIYKRFSLLGVLFILMSVLTAPIAEAHGENGLPGFLRLRTVTFFDVNFTPNQEQFKQGDEMTITGKLKILESWPTNVAEPKVAYISVDAPGPAVLVKERWVNGEFTPGSIFVEKGKVYDFKVKVTFRKEGRYHVHPSLLVEHAGPLIGPGHWVDVKASTTPFTNPITLINGKTVDLEKYGLGTVVGWHLIFFAIGAIWLVYWLVRPVLARMLLVEQGKFSELVSKRDKIAGAVIAVVVAMTLFGGYTYAKTAFPGGIPQQVYRFAPEDLKLNHFVTYKVESATYGPTTQTVVMKVLITNHGSDPVRVTQFSTAYIDFVNKALAKPDTEHVMTVSPDARITPGETKSVELTLQDEIWQKANLLPIEEAQISMAGLLFVQDDKGNRDFGTIAAPLKTDYQTILEVLKKKEEFIR